MREEKVYQIIRKKQQVEKDLKEMNDLKYEAFKVFGAGFTLSLEQIKKSYEEGAWNKLITWHFESNNHEGLFFFRNPKLLDENFKELDNAMINRKEFEDNLKDAREDVENYIKSLEDVLEELNDKLDELYNEYVKTETGTYDWIFQQPFMKDIFFKFLDF